MRREGYFLRIYSRSQKERDAMYFRYCPDINYRSWVCTHHKSKPFMFNWIIEILEIILIVFGGGLFWSATVFECYCLTFCSISAAPYNRIDLKLHKITALEDEKQIMHFQPSVVRPSRYKPVSKIAIVRAKSCNTKKFRKYCPVI